MVVLACKILARLIVLHGSSYSKKFSEKTGGYTILQQRLKRWWNIPALWPICFSIFFGYDVASLDLDRPFDKFGLLDLFLPHGKEDVVFPEMLPVIIEMVKSGLRSAILAGDVTEISARGQGSLDDWLSKCDKPKMASSNLTGGFKQEVFTRR